MKKMVGLMTIGLIILGLAENTSASLVAYWGFNETAGLTAVDDIGEVNGTLVGGTALVSNR